MQRLWAAMRPLAGLGGRLRTALCRVLAGTGVVAAGLCLGAPPDLSDDWKTMPAAGLRIHYLPEDATLASGLARSGPPIRQRLAAILGSDATLPVDVVLIPANEGKVEQDIPRAPEWASGFTVSGSGVLFVRVRTLGVYPDRDLTSVFAHELGHAELARLAGAGRLPRWFEEGTCMVLARPWDLRDSYSLTLAVLFHQDISLLTMERRFPQEARAARAAYARSFSFVSWLAENGGGATALGRVAREVGQGVPFDTAFAGVFHMTPARAMTVWKASVGRWYRVVSVITGTTTFWGVAALLFILTVVRHRRRNRAILERWEAEEGPDDRPPGPITPA